MAARAVSRLAKLSIPKLQGATPRPRLFQIMTESSQRPLVWVFGPPGCGKTTLTASYLKQCSPTILWYRVDQGDADLPTVFHYLREAALGVAPEAAQALPLLTPEYSLDIAKFARSFFRSLFGLLAAPAVWVIDNYQDAAPDLFDDILRIAVEELPSGGNIYVLSREAPPGKLLSMQVQAALSTIDWHALRLGLEEAQAIAERAEVSDMELVRHLYTNCDGWVAGFVLLLEYSKKMGAPEVDASIKVRQPLFNYFSLELFESVSLSVQRLVLSTALLPSFTALQVETFASPDQVEGVLDWLYKRNFFIDRREGPEPVYQYHALFREFLLERGRAFFSEPERRALLLKAAHSAEARQAETAIDLFVEAQDWTESARLILAIAPMLLQQGRNATLQHLIGLLPEKTTRETPMLEFWCGRARMPFDPPEGRKHLERAYESFEACGDFVTAVQVCGAILHSIFLESCDLRQSDVWIARLQALMTQPAVRAAPQMEVQMLPALNGALLRHSGHRFVAEMINRNSEEIWKLEDAEPRMAAAATVGHYFAITGQLARGQRLLEQMNALLPTTAVSPLNQLSWLAVETAYSHHLFGLGERKTALVKLEQALQLTAASHIHVLDGVIAGHGVYLAFKMGDLARAEKMVAIIERVMAPSRLLDVFHYKWLKAALAYMRGEVNTAHELAMECQLIAEQSGCRIAGAQTWLLLVHTLLHKGQRNEALQAADALVSASQEIAAGSMEYVGRLLKSHVLLDSDNNYAGLTALREALAYGRQCGQMTPSPWCDPRVVQRLCEIALKSDMETQYVSRMIEWLGLQARDQSTEAWPWPVKIYTLGRFAAFVDGEPLQFVGKTQRKPVELLKYLAIQGGQGADINTLTAQLWSELEGDSARNALDLALFRLRKLLKQKDAVDMRGSRLALNRSVVWVDVCAFDAWYEANVGAGGARVDDLRLAAKNLLQIYRGPLLGDEQESWALTVRERVRSKFARSVAFLTQRMEAQSLWNVVTTLCRGAIELDPLDEEFHRALMRSFRAQGRTAEAKAAYHRCRELFAKVLNAEPSASTRAIYRSLMQK